MKYNTYKKIRALVLIATIAFFAASAINGMVGLFDSISATAASARMDNNVMLNIIIYIYAVASGLVAIGAIIFAVRNRIFCGEDEYNAFMWKYRTRNWHTYEIRGGHRGQITNMIICDKLLVTVKAPNIQSAYQYAHSHFWGNGIVAFSVTEVADSNNY